MRWVCVALLLAMATTAAAQLGLTWQPPLKIVSGRGERGDWRQNESQWDYVDDPTVALQARGAAAVAWVDQRQKDVFFQVYEPDGKPRLREPVDVSRTPAVFSWLPRIALAADRPDDIYILWQEIIFSGGSHGGDILFARSQDGGATFSAPLNLSRSVPGDGKGRTTASDWDNGSLDIAVAPDGKIYAAWTEYDGPLWFRRSDDRGASFSKPLRVFGDDKQPARAPALAVGRDGAVYLAWTNGEDARADVRVARSDDGRAFNEPVVVAQTASYSDAPKLAIDAEGILHVAFTERSPNFKSAAVHYTRSSDRGGKFSPPRRISTDGAAFPSLALGARGELFCLWEVYPNARSGGSGLGATISRDARRTFSKPETIPGSSDPTGGVNGSNQGKLMRKLAVGTDGRVAIVNSSLKHGHHSRVWLIRGE